MENVKRACSWIKMLTVFACIFAGIWFVFYNQTMLQTQPYTLLHWAGIAIVIIVVCQKISDYTAIFTDPHQSLMTVGLQFLFVPVFMEILTRFCHFPATLALAFSLAAFSPGELSHTILKTLFITGCLFFLDFTGFYSPWLNKGVDLATDPMTRYVLLGIAFVPIVYHELRKHMEKQKPVAIHYLSEDDE